jgi:hypothetical protein
LFDSSGRAEWRRRRISRDGPVAYAEVDQLEGRSRLAPLKAQPDHVTAG